LIQTSFLNGIETVTRLCEHIGLGEQHRFIGFGFVFHGIYFKFFHLKCKDMLLRCNTKDIRHKITVIHRIFSKKLAIASKKLAIASKKLAIALLGPFPTTALKGAEKCTKKVLKITSKCTGHFFDFRRTKSGEKSKPKERH
ncbi:hypothetical protein EZS27_041101, partial [termite gut metagenome]